MILMFAMLFAYNVYPQKKGIPAELLNRNWNRTVTTPPTIYTLIFNSDSTFSFTNPANNASFSLKCQFDDDVITFPAVGCSDEGKYKFTLNGDDLIFKMENDLCKDRSDAMIGTWKSVKKENE